MPSRLDDEASSDAMAAEWVVRGLSPDLSENDLLELAQWLEASETHALAYGRALAVWSDLPENAETYITQGDDDVVLAQKLSSGLARLADYRKSQQRKSRRVILGVAASAMAACFAVAVIWPRVAPQTPFTVYETQKGQRRDVRLADGTQLSLNTDTRASVQVSSTGRKLVLDHGEIGLKVVHDAARPFVVSAGGVTATDLGTQFNVRRTDGQVRVAVTEGEVKMGTGTTMLQSALLKRGDLGLYQEGTTGLRLTRVNPDDVFAWTHGHAIYHNEPLGEVVKDLNRYFDKPIRVDSRTADHRLTAILTLDSETAVVGRLQTYLSLDATTTDQDITLHQPDRSGSDRRYDR